MTDADGATAPVGADFTSWVVASTRVIGAAVSPSIETVSASAGGLVVDIETGLGSGTAPAYFSLRPHLSDLPASFPIIVSPGFLTANSVAIGDSVRLPALRVDASATIAGTVSAFPTLDLTLGEAVLLDLATLQSLAYEPGLGPPGASEYWMSVDGDDSMVVAELASPPLNSSGVQSRRELADQLVSDPVALGTIGALTLGFVAAAVFAAVGFAVSATVSARERMVEFALLRALGLSGRQLGLWLAVEQGALVLVSLGLGTLIGIVLTATLLPLVSLTQTGEPAVPAVIVEYPWTAIIGLELAVVAVLAVIVVVMTVLLRRVGLGSLLRLGEDWMAPSRSGSMTVGWKALWRQLMATPAVVIGISLSTLLAVFLLAAAPRLLELVADDDLRATVSEPEPAQRNIRVERLGRIGAGPPGDPFRSVRDTGDAFASSEIPPALRGVISGHYFLVDTPRFEVAAMPGEDMPHPFPVYLRYRYQEGIEDRVDLVSGELPQTQAPVAILVGEACPEEPDAQTQLIDELSAGVAVEIECVLTEVPHFQVAGPASTAEAMGLELGRRVVLTPDPTDRLVFGLSGDELDYRFVMSISGIIELDDVADEYWYGDPSLHLPAIRENADLRVIYATGLMGPDDYGPMLGVTGEAGRSYVWRHFVDPDLVVAAGADTLQAELTPFQLQYSAVSREPTDYTVVTQLGGLLDTHEAQRAETVSLLSLSVAGLFAVVVSVVAVLSVLMTRRQHTAIVLTRGRGGSSGQMVLTRLYGALLLVIPAASAGYVVAAALFPDTGSLVPYRVTVILATLILLCLVCAGLNVFIAPLGLLRPSSLVALPRGSTRRVVVEVLRDGGGGRLGSPAPPTRPGGAVRGRVRSPAGGGTHPGRPRGGPAPDPCLSALGVGACRAGGEGSWPGALRRSASDPPDGLRVASPPPRHRGLRCHGHLRIDAELARSSRDRSPSPGTRSEPTTRSRDSVPTSSFPTPSTSTPWAHGSILRWASRSPMPSPSASAPVTAPRPSPSTPRRTPT